MAFFNQPNNTANPIMPLAGNQDRGLNLNWNGQIRECSITALEGNYASFGTISFPVESCSTSFSQDIVLHKRPNIPGAKIESLGANPLEFRLVCPFIFGLQRGNGETWTDLFPDTFTTVIQLLNDTVSPTIDFVHPILGHYFVKAKGGHTTTDANLRNGQILEFELIEANVDKIAVADLYSTAQDAANLYDSQILELDPPPPPEVTSINMTQLVQQVRGFIDTTTLFINQASSKINGAIFQVQMVEQSLQRLKSASTSGLLIQLEKIKAGLNSLKTGALQQQNSLKVYIVPRNMTLCAVALILQHDVNSLVRLNPSISNSPIIRVGAQIVYQGS